MPREYIYPSVVTLLFLVAYFYFRVRLRGVKKKRRRHVQRRSYTDAIETDSPQDAPQEELKARGLSALDSRFSFIQKMLPLILGSFWAVFVFGPHIGSIPAVYISIVAGVASVVVGVSLRPFLENLFSGVVISFFRSIRIGDSVIIDGHYGLIEEIGLTYTVLKKWDWNRIVIPNTMLLQKEVQNLTMNDSYIWTHAEFFVNPNADIVKVEEMAIQAAKSSRYFLDSEDPTFWVMDMQKDSIKCWIAAWAKNPSDAWELRNDIRTALAKSLLREGIPFHEHRVVGPKESVPITGLDHSPAK